MAYKVDASFARPRFKKAESPGDVARMVEEEMGQWAKKLNDQLQRIARTSPESGGDIVIKNLIGSAAAAGGGNGGAIAFDKWRAGSKAVVVAGTVVTFTRALPTDTYLLAITKRVDARGRTMPVKITDVTSGNFKVTPLRNGTIEYFAIPFN